MLELRYEAPAGDVQLFLDNRPVPVDEGVAVIPVRPEADHWLMWIVRGQPGTAYRIEIVHPQEASMTVEETIGARRRGVGVRWFRVPRSAEDRTWFARAAEGGALAALRAR